MSAGERRLAWAFRLGAALGLVLFLIVLTGGRATLTSWVPAGDFYDAQADSLLEGRLDIDPERLGIEGFESGGRTYMYQPPFPALLRMPIAAVTDSYEGRLGQLSMLAALLVALSATRRILIHARRSVRPAAERGVRPDQFVTKLEVAASFALGLVVAGGSVPVFLASRAWVYHESAMWGMAWTLAAFAALLAHRRSPTWGSVALVGGATLFAVGSRASVGAGACAAVGLTGALVLLRNRDVPLRARLAGPGGALALIAVAALPAFAYASLNVAKFGTVASIPFEDQVFTKLSPARQAMLEQNDGSLFGLQFAPTTMVHYLRPDGVDLTSTFPFVDFRPPGGPVVGDVTFDLVDRTASIPASLPALVVPAAVGVWTLWRRRPSDQLWWLAIAVGGLVGTATIIPFGYVAHRYLADAMPMLVLLATLGIAGAATAAESSDPRRARSARFGALAVLLVLVPVTVWINTGLATVYQRLYAPQPKTDLVAGLVEARLRVGAEPEILRADALPATAQPGDLVAIGDCEALYIWDGTPEGEFRTDAWVPVERTEPAGHVQLSVALTDLPVGERHVLAIAPDAGPAVAWIERQPDGSIVAGLDGNQMSAVGSPVQPAGRHSFDVVLDPYLGEASIRLGDELLVSTTMPRGTDVSGLIVGDDDARPVGTRGGDGDLCRQAVG